MSSEPAVSPVRVLSWQVLELLRRNGVALEALTEALLQEERLGGERVVELVDANACAEDLAERAKWAGHALL